MKPIFKEYSEEGDYSPVTPASQLSTMTALTPLSSLSPLSPFALLYFRNLSSYSGFSMLAEAETKKANEVKNIKTVCGCSKTKCLKLYCDCFAEGKFCEDCDIVMIKTKGKNPGAFRDDISDNYKICHCSKSFCLKKYCECYQNGRSCNSNCKCKQCKNIHEEKTV